jgi:thiamine biosynthesis lipoprotein
MSATVYAATFWAMGCTFRVCLAARAAAQARRAVHGARTLIRNLEGVLSRFREDSELVRLNRSGGGWRQIHPILWDAVRCALWAAKATGGLYDPTVLDRVEASGYVHAFRPGQRATRLPPPDPQVFGRWRAVRVHPGKPLVSLPPGVRLDLGGVGKAFAAEWVASRLSRFGPCLVDAGGDLVVRGTPEGWPGWPVAVEGGAGVAGVLWLRKGSLATSGTTVRRWWAADQEVHHIIDPRCGLPARTDLSAATVWAPNAVEANAHALALVVLGSAGARAYLQGRPHVRAALVRTDGSSELLGLGLQDPGGDLLPGGG